MATELAKSNPYEMIRSGLDRSRGEIQRALPPRGIDANRLIRVALTAIRSNPLLMECSRESIIGAVMQAAQLGLEPDGLLGYAYLVPYRGKSGQAAQLIIGYRGLIDLARRSGRITSISARVVREGDEFRWAYGLSEALHHVPLGDPSRPLTYVYAVARLTDGGAAFEVMSRKEVEAIRAKSRAGRSGPWVEFFDEMARKTCVRRLCKYLPMSTDVQRAVALDEAHDAGIDTGTEAIGIAVVEGRSAEVIDAMTGEVTTVEYTEAEREPGEEG